MPVGAHSLSTANTVSNLEKPVQTTAFPGFQARSVLSFSVEVVIGSFLGNKIRLCFKRTCLFMHVLISILTLFYGQNRGDKKKKKKVEKDMGGIVSEGKQHEIRVEFTCDRVVCMT